MILCYDFRCAGPESVKLFCDTRCTGTDSLTVCFERLCTRTDRVTLCCGSQYRGSDRVTVFFECRCTINGSVKFFETLGVQELIY